MQRDALLQLLRQLESGDITAEQTADKLASLPFEDLEFAKVDHHRSLRSGLPEVVFAAGKTAEETATILSRIHASGTPALATRADAAAFEATQKLIPDAKYHARARAITCGDGAKKSGGRVAVICAGTSDLNVAEEAAITADFFGATVSRFTDVGVAGLHRLLAHLNAIREADAVICCAGMEGALPSVVGGLVAVPVIAVPTSVGYGAAFGGVAALLGMLNSCSPNITVTNIDNGFGAGYVATLYSNRAVR
ncbi:nickel pincer cofactor biosynthesis protein LarB [Terriglobus sp. ADX1]|uniref:nickel pincer cofactor biosynthesis protein LarB n=1 Tax=Terriglobus sp. ADX1 TaxID=2794063 RepID=UPI002FE64D5E